VVEGRECVLGPPGGDGIGYLGSGVQMAQQLC
jgi:hypothetical protein